MHTAARASEVLLTITGSDSKIAKEGMIKLTRKDLEAMPQDSFTTNTIWTDGKQVFTGVRLSDLLDAVGAVGKALKATAINNYSVEIPISDAVKDGPMIALTQNGKAMSVRNKGPLWIVYPYDSKSLYQSEKIYSRSIWQLDRIELQR